ncbi:MAG: Choline-sulfatase [Pseudomonadota bacterium]|jgi:arylsulfatase A-like enzyme
MDTMANHTPQARTESCRPWSLRLVLIGGLLFIAAGCTAAEETASDPLPAPSMATGAGGQQMELPDGAPASGGAGGVETGAGAGGAAAGGAPAVGGQPDMSAGGAVPPAEGGSGGGSGGEAGGASTEPPPSPIVLGPKPNVLLIMVDDLNDWAGYLGGNTQARTPNLDALAKQSVAFHRAYANSPSCNPSRASMMLGKYPHSTGLYANQVVGGGGTIDMRATYPDRVTLPQYFSANGYRTFRTGKVFHYFGDWADGGAMKVDVSFQETNNGGAGVQAGASWPFSGINWEYDYIDWHAFEEPYTAFEPYIRASVIENELKKPAGTPFFMAAGFYLPHLPWYYPKSVLDEPALAHIKNVEDVQIPRGVMENDLADLSEPGQTLARTADSKPTSINGGVAYASWHDAITQTGKWKEAVQAYLASIYFVDMQLGRILQALEASPHAKNTIVVLVGDHGWMLGEKNAWSKYKPWEQSVRTHFLIKAPGAPARRVETPVGLVNLYRTLVDLAGLPEKTDLDGRTLRPLLEGPDTNWDHPVVSAHDDWNGGWQTVRDRQYRLIRYFKDGSEELYDHNADPEEWNNLANDPKLKDVKARLGQHLAASKAPLGSWKPATP